MKLILVLISVFSFRLFAADGIYLSTSIAPVYGSGDSDQTTALLGTGISAMGGLRLKNIGFELGVKRFNVTNEQLGAKKYDSEIKDSIFLGGGRLLINDIFSLKFGAAIHYVEMDLYEGNNHLKDEEEDGEYLGLYGGMGIMHPLSKSLDLYYESTLFPVPEIGLYFIDVELGVRIYL